MKEYLLSLIMFCFVGVISVFSQNPSHYVLGGDFLQGVKVYDLIQDNDNIYWVVSDQGLFRYDGYEFEYIENEFITGSSLFNLRKDSKGTIYFNDLKNRVFSVVNQDVKLFYELNSNEGHHNIFLETNEENNLLIQAENLVIVNDDEITNYPYEIDPNKARVSFHILGDGSTICTTLKQSVIVKDGVMELYQTDSLENGHIPGPSAWISLEDKDYCIDQNTMQLFEYDIANNLFNFKKTLHEELVGTALRIYEVHDQIWLIGSRNGVYTYDRNWEPLNDGKPIFEEYFISDVYTDHEGNVLCSTFDEGIIIVPSLEMKSYEVPLGIKIADLISYSDSLILIGTTEGSLLMVNPFSATQNKLYQSLNGEAVDYVNYSSHNDLILFATPKGYAIATLNGNELDIKAEFTGAVKSAYFINETCYVALNTGVTKIDLNTFAFEKEVYLNERAFDVVLEEETKTLYTAMPEGLVIKQLSGEPILKKMNGLPINSTSLASGNNMVYVGCGNGEMLIFHDNEIIETINFNAPIKKIECGNSLIFVKTLESVHLLNAETGEKIRLVHSMGFNEDKIQDVSFFSDLLFFSESNAISWMDVDSFTSEFPSIDISIKAVLNNGKVTSQTTFPYTSSSIGFEFNVSTIHYQDQVTYEYKLIGLKDQWIELPYEQNQIEFISLPPGQYEFKVRSVNGKKVSDTVSYSFNIDAPYYQKAWFYLLLLTLSLIVFYLFYRYRIGVLRKKNQIAIEQQKMQTDLLEMELRALRSQMNPHFIFNSLNSIQSLVLKEDIDNSYDYLVLFAKLVRNTLNYSNLNFIPIEKEIEFLEIYLSLEKLRFKKDFTYQIEFEGSKDFNVPPLVIQPFLENALVHGLLHKDGNKNLSVKLILNDSLTCIIEDNGVGRHRSSEIEQRSKLSEHKSFAMKAIQQRLDLLNKHLGKEVGGFDVIDLEENGESLGTKVILKLPIERNY